MKKISLLIGLMIAGAFGSHAQTDSLHLPKRLYVYGDVEFGEGEKMGQVYMQFSLTLQRKHNYFRLKVAGSGPLIIWVAATKEPRITELAWVFGKSYTAFKYHNLKFGTGIAYVRDVRDNFREKTFKEALGLPFEVKYCYMFD